MKYWKAAIFFFIGFISQSSLLNIFKLGSATPNLLLCLVAVFGFIYDEEPYGVYFGALFGLLYDVCFSSCVGVTAIPLTLTAVAVYYAWGLMIQTRAWSMAITGLGCWILYYSLNWLLLRMTGSSFGYFAMLQRLIGSFIYTMALILLLYFILHKRNIKEKSRYY